MPSVTVLIDKIKSLPWLPLILSARVCYADAAPPIATTGELKGMALFPSIIHENISERISSENANKKTILEIDPATLASPLERGILMMLQGSEMLQTRQTKAAAVRLEDALKLLPKESQLRPVAELLYLESKIPATKPIESLRKLKALTKQYPTLAEWRPEQYALMLDVLIEAKSDAVLLRTWDEYEDKVRPAQRSDQIALRVSDYLDSRIKTPSKELVSVLESMAALYPYSEVSRWAFQKLQGFSCSTTPAKKAYFPSTWLLSRLAGNSVLDPGLRSYVLEVIKGPIRSHNGDIKVLDTNERIAFLIQSRLVNEAQELAHVEVSETYPGQFGIAQVRRARALFQLGQIQARQSDWSAAAATFSRYLEEFSDKYDSRNAMEILADSLVRLRQHRVAAQIYARLATLPSSDSVLKWHHFWNTYLAGDYKEALALLDRPGYVPSRDRGIEGGLEYWRARILEKLGQKSAAEEVFKKVLATNGDSFYSILIQAGRPNLRDQKEASLAPVFHDGAMDIKDELSGRDGFAAKILDNGQNPSATELASGERLDIGVSRLLQKWGQYRLARRLLRTTAWSRVVAHKMFPEIADLAFSLGDFGFGLKVAALPDSPFKQVPSAVRDLREHMAKYNADWRLMYPMAHERLAMKYADAAAIDPQLVLSIMRAESVYDPDARSIVGAQGLMQMMPFTAIRIARLMGDDQFEIKHLHMPEVNIGYGAFYLRKLIDYYRGNVVLAVAGYNAGPTHVDRWLTAFGDLEMDEFTESISFKETRRYVKSVLRNFNQYRNIYSEKPALINLPALPQKRSDFELF